MQLQLFKKYILKEQYKLILQFKKILKLQNLIFIKYNFT